MIEANKSGLKDRADTFAAHFNPPNPMPTHDLVRDYIDLRTGGLFGPARLDILTGMTMARIRKAHSEQKS